jgi:hypothetical protein
MTQRSAFVSTLLLVLLGAVMSYKIPILKPSVTPSSSSMKTLRKDLAAKIVIGMFVVMPIDKAVDFMPVTPHVAVADSTGKVRAYTMNEKLNTHTCSPVSKHLIYLHICMFARTLQELV